MNLFDFHRLLAATATALAAATLPMAHSATLIVDPSVTGCVTGPVYTTIQSAVNAAQAGDTVQVCPGIYDEQVVVDQKNGLRLRGSGTSLTILRPTQPVPKAYALIARVPALVTPIIMVNDATGFVVEQMTIDGAGTDNPTANFDCGAWSQFIGVYFRNGSGTVRGTRVTRMRSASLCSYGIRTEAAGGSTSAAVVSGTLLDHYGDAAVSCVGFGAECALRDNTMRGEGPLDTIFQTGVMVRRGATAQIAGNTITGHVWAPKFRGIAGKGVGVFLVNAQPDANPFLQRDNVFADNELDVQRIQTAEVVD